MPRVGQLLIILEDLDIEIATAREWKDKGITSGGDQCDDQNQEKFVRVPCARLERENRSGAVI